MPKENNQLNKKLIEHLEHIQSLLDEALTMAKGTAGPVARERPRKVRDLTSPQELDFSMPIRAFVKKNGQKMSGPKKFTLLVAYFAKGDVSKQVSLNEIERNWNKLTGIFGSNFNPAHTSRARENDWVTTAKAGSYHLRPGWKGILA